MILLLDTSTPICKLSLIEGKWRYDAEWEAGRELSRGLLAYIKEQLEKNGRTFSDITGIGVYKGPGSFTGLRIGLAVLNTLADAQDIPIVGATGDIWQEEAAMRLEQNKNDRLVLPLYTSEPHITKPRK